MNPDETKFGFQTVKQAEKAKRVGEVFDSVSSNYDLMNNLMSLGLHNVWKKTLIDTSSLKAKAKILDIAAGTADLTLAFAKANKDYEILQTDINHSMLMEGQKKLINSGVIIPAITCDAEALPFADNYFDCVTIAFGLRNMTRKENALREVYRVLSPGGKVLILEFSHIYQPFQKLYDAFSFKFIPILGKLFAKDELSYRYLVESIRVHPSQEELKEMMEAEAFEKVSYTNMSAGIVAIHKGYKF
ncbi:class I SAM-dependent methyltransferase [Methylophilaceae bacterium]|jgi:demethylmenaquinone methyltransferase/2-methoxy-6-polyprenyl-1,4-benzoquinol methylase|nr:class I SAM-dependent methyltransferase [Betaproteobacteria bacterium]MDA9086040.1 class I SAM-dependent methyltransferase [Methylophilaceae bacterium]MCH9841836.1 class I SAM-dependent methyltransferase [Betaproteobacteria bacterium]MDA9087535.1 class I SAM-dependent methyltransferase [Methylophilaceae bacterium]MDA9096962.1 class I SAM-dependent methyltransferase [Methylophilaceae bacterium]